MGRIPLAFTTSVFSLWATSAIAGSYRLPWPTGIAMELTQDCNDSHYADHIGSGKHAWDFANGTRFPVLASRGGIVSHVKVSSHSGCETSACVDLANYVVIDHGDGTASIYLHVDGDSLDPSVRCGKPVSQGQHLATAGSTGWSTGPHLHFQVNAVHTEKNSATCECGEDGLACDANEAGWSAFWSTSRYPSMPVSFDEWTASECGDRRMLLPFSQNVEPPGDTRVVMLGRQVQSRPVVILGVGGRKWPGALLTDKARTRSPEIRVPSPRAPSAVRPRP